MRNRQSSMIVLALAIFLIIIIYFFQSEALFGPMSNTSMNRDQAQSQSEADQGERTATAEPLPIPELLEDTNPHPDQATFDIVSQNGSKTFVNDVETETMGYNGDYLGPVIRVRRGEEVTINVENQLEDELTTIHWHGLEVDGEADGGPHSGILSGETWSPTFTVDQPAATLWYHPHPEKNTGRQVYKGLAGLLFVEDEVSDQLAIPKTYGENDIPLIVQDKQFNADGRFNYHLAMPDIMTGLQGDTMLVNGSIDPYLEVNQEMIRLRILNGSNASIFELAFDSGITFHQIASDGGFLTEPVEMDQLRLGPSERAEILVDFSQVTKGEVVQLMNRNQTFMRFNVEEQAETAFTVPDSLTTIEPIEPSEAVRTRQFVFQGMGPSVNINGKQFDIDRIDETISLGDTEIWEVSNDSGMGMMGGTVHPFHAHGVQFQILDRDGRAPAPNEKGWKDTFIVEPGETVRVIATFNSPGVFMYHCHILEHEDAGMMGQFEVK